MKLSFSARAGVRALCLLFAFAFFSCAEEVPADPVVKQAFVMDTTIILTMFSSNAEAVSDRIFKRFGEIDRAVRVQSRDSEAWAINENAGKAPVKVSQDTFEVSRLAYELASLSNGAFDATIGPISALWDIQSDNPKVPSRDQIASLLPLVNWRDMVVDDASRSVYLKRPSMRIDFGGVAKGYAAHEAIRIFREMKVKSALVNMGDSTIITLGRKPNGKEWRIGIQCPEIVDGAVDHSKLLGIVECSDAVVQSSGVYERYFIRDGKRYHHIMDPKTGYPMDNGLEQVTLILPPDYRYADGLSTTVFVLGPKEGLRLVSTIPGAAALLVTSDRKIYANAEGAKHFKLSDTRYSLIQQP